MTGQLVTWTFQDLRKVMKQSNIMNKRICGKQISILQREFAYNTKRLKTTFLAPAWDFAITSLCLETWNATVDEHLCYVAHVNTKAKWNPLTILWMLPRIDPLQHPVAWYWINYAGTQITQWNFQTNESRARLLRVPMLWKSHCVICVPA